MNIIGPLRSFFKQKVEMDKKLEEDPYKDLYRYQLVMVHVKNHDFIKITSPAKNFYELLFLVKNAERLSTLTIDGEEEKFNARIEINTEEKIIEVLLETYSARNLLLWQREESSRQKREEEKEKTHSHPLPTLIPFDLDPDLESLSVFDSFEPKPPLYSLIGCDKLKEYIWTMPVSEIADMHNTSMESIIKECKSYDNFAMPPSWFWAVVKSGRIPHPNGKPIDPIEYIDREKLQKEVWSMSQKKVADLYNVPGKVIREWCEKLDIPRPPKYFWNKVQHGKIPHPNGKPIIEQHSKK